MEVVAEEDPQRVNDTRPEPHHQNAEKQETYSSAEEYREEEMTDAHLRDRRSKSKDLKRRRWGKHGRKHEAPERMPLERGMKLFKALG